MGSALSNAVDYPRQLAELKEWGTSKMGGVPTVIGECGIPFNMGNVRSMHHAVYHHAIHHAIHHSLRHGKCEIPRIYLASISHLFRICNASISHLFRIHLAFNAEILTSISPSMQRSHIYLAFNAEIPTSISHANGCLLQLTCCVCSHSAA